MLSMLHPVNIMHWYDKAIIYPDAELLW